MTPLNAAMLKSTYAEAQRLQAAGQSEAALKLYGKIAEANPKIPEVQFQIGRLFTEGLRIDRAIMHLRTAAALKPAEPAVWQAWADAAALAADDAAETAFLTALRASPLAPAARLPLEDRFRAHRAKSRPATGGLMPAEIAGLVALFGKGRFAEAAAHAQVLLKTAPKSAVVMNVLGSAQERLGKPDEALATFRAVVAIDPAYAEAHTHLGQLLLDLDRVKEALPPLRRAVALTPGSVPALVTLGRALTRGGDGVTAMRYIGRALSIAPRDVPALIAAGNAETRRTRYAEAEAALLAAEAAAGGELPDEARVVLAQAQARQGKDDAAMANFDRVLARSPTLSSALTGKAGLLQTLGRFDEAEPWFRQAFAAGNVGGEAYRLFVTTQRMKPGDPILDQMRARFDDPATPDDDRAHLGFAIAKALEDIKDHGAVFRYLDAANALVRKAHPWDIAQRRAEVAETKRAQDGFDFAAARIEGASDYAPIFVTGMPRSGTTLVEQIISSHSQVAGAGEVGVGTRLAQALLRQGVKGGYRHVSDLAGDEIARMGHDYAAQMRARFPDAPQITDKSIQTYMFMGLIRMALPKARFIVVRRDPRDTLLSIYKNKFPDGTHLYAYDQRDLARYWQTFEEMIGFWRDRLPGGFHEIRYEDLVADPEPQTRALIAACGLPWEDACLSFHENDRKVETLSVFQVRQPIYGGSLGGWQRHAADLAPMLEELGDVAG